MTAQVCDLSRTGLRLRSETGDLGVETAAGAEEVGALVRKRLRSHFVVSLNHDRLGSLLQRRVELIRVELPEADPQGVELCCQFSEPLEQAEAELLESHLPPVRRTVVPEPAAMSPSTPPSAGVLNGPVLSTPVTGPIAVQRPQGAPPTDGGRPRQRYRALVSATRKDTLQTFRCHTDLVTGVGIRIAIPRGGYGDATAAAARKFVKRYGKQLDLRVSDETLDIWSGRVRVSGVELPANRPDMMLVTLAFDRSLALNELRSLGLIQHVA